ncbi:nucleotidyltransferase family protein [Paenibacillus sp. 2TAB19]|uniref:nucleotidyltransferase family protein n=1 Tax=Paenibacillus sp. 2TAB19 TaxID=3233003 RepID=UPI003F9A2322
MQELLLKDKLIQILLTKEDLLRDLRIVQQMGLPSWYISAGYVRNYVWDHLHGYEQATPLNDVDIVYYDPNDIEEQTEKRWESNLIESYPHYNWSAKNQARMHLRNLAEPYHSVEDAMKRWPETVTALGIYLNAEDQIEVIAPHGLGDLFDLVIRRSPYFQDKDYFYQRVASKGWLKTWPQLTLIEET